MKAAKAAFFFRLVCRALHRFVLRPFLDTPARLLVQAVQFRLPKRVCLFICLF